MTQSIANHHMDNHRSETVNLEHSTFHLVTMGIASYTLAFFQREHRMNRCCNFAERVDCKMVAVDKMRMVWWHCYRIAMER
jgi:hypothetical protein